MHPTGATSPTTWRATSCTRSSVRARSSYRGHNRDVANQKQRRKRAKEKRHAYELVEIDSEGNETVLTASAVRSESAERDPRREKSRQGTKEKGGRGPQPPTWPRVLKRGALFGPIFLATVLLI